MLMVIRKEHEDLKEAAENVAVLVSLQNVTA